MFRRANVDHLSNFAFKIGSGKALVDELTGAMFAFEITFSKNWFKLWLESGFKLVIRAFTSP